MRLHFTGPFNEVSVSSLNQNTSKAVEVNENQIHQKKIKIKSPIQIKVKKSYLRALTRIISAPWGAQPCVGSIPGIISFLQLGFSKATIT